MTKGKKKSLTGKLQTKESRNSAKPRSSKGKRAGEDSTRAVPGGRIGLGWWGVQGNGRVKGPRLWTYWVALNWSGVHSKEGRGSRRDGSTTPRLRLKRGTLQSYAAKFTLKVQKGDPKYDFKKKTPGQ